MSFAYIKKNWKIVAILAVSILAAFLIPKFTFPQGNTENIPASRAINITGVNTTVVNVTGTNITADDKNFQIWFTLSYKPIVDDLNCISKAAEKENFTDTVSCAKFLKEDSNRSLNQIGSYNVSPYFRPPLDKYKKALEYYSIGGENLEIGARNGDIEKMNAASKYIQQANDVMKNVTEDMQSLSFLK